MTRAYFDSTNVTLRHDLVIDLRIDELAELRPTATIVLVTGPDGAVPTIDGATVRCDEPGRYHFRLENALGREDLHVCVVAGDVFPFVAAHVRTVGHGDILAGPPSDAKVRAVVRSLVNRASWFDGTLASLTTGEPSRSLAQFGA